MAMRTTMSGARDIKVLFGIWEQNVETARAINRVSTNNSTYAAVARDLVTI